MADPEEPLTPAEPPDVSPEGGSPASTPAAEATGHPAEAQSREAEEPVSLEEKVQPAAAQSPTEEKPETRTIGLIEFLREKPEVPILVSERELRRHSRRDFILFGAGAAAAAAGFWWILPADTRGRVLSEGKREWLDSLEARLGASEKRRENILNRALTFDDDVAEALYSRSRLVRTYRKSDIMPLRNNYDGQTPAPDYIPGWALTVDGLASGRTEVFTIGDLLSRFRSVEQVTRLCCVEGWSAVAWWGGLRWADFLAAYPPRGDARWARLDSSVNLDSDGNADPYYVSIDLETARHPQTLLATHQNARTLSVEHGAPLRLLVPMKLGLKNIKAVTGITYSALEPPDYWNERGYSRYDGL